MMVVLLTTGIAACTNSDTKNENPVTQTDTSGLRRMVENGEVYTCKMHNEVIGDKPGKCPTCGMTLVKQKIPDAQKIMFEKGTYTKPNY